MHEFQTFAYLPVQKTGTTFISRFLERFSNEELVRLESHQPMDANCDRTKFYFISVRHPLDAYISLYSYGTRKRGKMGRKLIKLGLRGLYDGTASGFNKWLSYVLQPENASVLDSHFAKSGGGRVAELIGLQSYRFLRLAMAGGEQLLMECNSKEDIRAVYTTNKLAQFTIRHETFTRDLCGLVRGPLSYAITDIEQAVNFIENTPPINSSRRVDRDQEIALEDAVKREFAEREWFLREEFGYGSDSATQKNGLGPPPRPMSSKSRP
jgi:hypothetical protein